MDTNETGEPSHAEMLAGQIVRKMDVMADICDEKCFFDGGIRSQMAFEIIGKMPPGVDGDILEDRREVRIKYAVFAEAMALPMMAEALAKLRKRGFQPSFEETKWKLPKSISDLDSLKKGAASVLAAVHPDDIKAKLLHIRLDSAPSEIGDMDDIEDEGDENDDALLDMD